MKSRPHVSLRFFKQYELRAFSHRLSTEELWVLEAEGERCDDVPRVPQSILHWWGLTSILILTVFSQIVEKLKIPVSENRAFQETAVFRKHRGHSNGKTTGLYPRSPAHICGGKLSVRFNTWIGKPLRFVRQFERNLANKSSN